MDKKILGARIREQRKQLDDNMSMERLAELAGITPAFLGEIERGVKMPSLKTYIDIVNALDISLDVLVYDQIKVATPHIFNEMTAKVKYLSSVQLKAVNDMLDVMLEGFRRENPPSDRVE